MAEAVVTGSACTAPAAAAPSGWKARASVAPSRRSTTRLLGSRFLTHPPICKIHVDVRDGDTRLTRGLGASFDVEDEPYFIELQHPASTRILLSADYGPTRRRRPSARSTPRTSAAGDGKTRVLGYHVTSPGGVTYFARPLPQSRHPSGARAGPTDTTPLTFRGSWETDAFLTCCATPSPWCGRRPTWGA